MNVYQRWAAMRRDHGLMNMGWNNLPGRDNYDDEVWAVVYAPVPGERLPEAYLRPHRDLSLMETLMAGVLDLLDRYLAGDPAAFQSREPGTGRPVAVVRLLAGTPPPE